jgi:predicted PurR-regulated permease PerM
MDKMKLEISTSTLIKIVLFGLVLWLIVALKEVIIILFVVAILVSALRPLVNQWGEKIGNKLAVFVIFILFVGVLIGVFYLIIPPLVVQLRQLIENIPGYISRYTALTEHFPSINRALSSLASLPIGSNVVNITTNFVGGIVSTLTTIILVIYFLLDQDIFAKNFEKLLPIHKRTKILKVIHKISEKVGNWLRGQFLLGLIIGTLVFIGLTIIKVPYALALAMIAALLEIIPIVGPFISGGLAVLVALTVSPITALIVLIYFLVMQQLEGNIIVPKIMQKAIGLPPAIIIIAILIGSKLLGITGALLAVPISGIIYVMIQEHSTIREITK